MVEPAGGHCTPMTLLSYSYWSPSASISLIPEQRSAIGVHRKEILADARSVDRILP